LVPSPPDEAAAPPTPPGRPGRRGGRRDLRKLLKGGLRGIPRGTIMLSIISAVNIVLGFGREGITAYYFGTSGSLDAFLVASTLPKLIVTHSTNITVSIILPLYVAHLEAERRAEATWLLQRWFRFLAKLMTVFCLVVGLFASVVVGLIGPGLEDAERAQAASWLRWLLPYVWIITLSGCFEVVLNQNRRFFMPAMAGGFLSLGIIISCVVFHDRIGVSSMVPGYLVGAVAAFGFQWKQNQEYEPKLMSFAELPGHIKLPLAAGGIMVLNSFAQQANLIIDRAFASSLPDGSIAALNYANAVTAVPQNILSAAIATALFPVLAETVARGAWRQAFRTTIRWAGAVIVVVSIPVAILAVWRQEIVALLFQRGAFTARATEMTSTAVYVLSFMLLVQGANALVLRLLLAQQQLRLILVTTITAVALKIGFNFLLVRDYGLAGVCMSMVASAGLVCIIRYLGASRYSPD
jgi:putative peptidoglycan lipid II flippase